MALKYRKISPSIWNDAKFRELSDHAKLVFFLLLTHPQTSAIGTLRAFIPGLAAELHWTEKAFREAFREALDKGLVKVDERAGLIWLPKFTKHNQPESPNVLRSWIGSFEECPECELKDEILLALKDFTEGLTEGFRKAFNQAFPKALPNQEQEQEQYISISPPIVGDTLVDATPGVSPQQGRKAIPPCPHQKIVQLYHDTLPELPRVKCWNKTREDHLRSRWRESCERKQLHTEAEGLDYFARLFGYIHDSDFLMGRVQRGDRTWQADFDWLIKPTNFAKVIEGRYHEQA